MALIRINCEFNTASHPCPLAEVITAGNPIGTGFWCGDFRQQQNCGNEVHEQKAHPISHHACHSPTIRKNDTQPRTSVGMGSVEDSQSAENKVVFEAGRNALRNFLIRNNMLIKTP